MLENSNLDWTVVRPVMLTDKNENLSILSNLRGIGKIKSSISRNAVAHFMLDCIEKGKFYKRKTRNFKRIDYSIPGSVFPDLQSNQKDFLPCD